MGPPTRTRRLLENHIIWSGPRCINRADGAATSGELPVDFKVSDYASGLLHTLRMAMVRGMTAVELHRHSIMTPYPTRESDLIYMLSPFLE